MKSQSPSEGGSQKLGAAGLLAAKFIDLKLTPILILFSVLLGGYATLMLPREEEPQIVVPMIDIFVSMPGASAREVEERVTKPMEKLIWEIEGVEYIYSTSSPGMALAVVRFEVGEDEEDAIVRLNQKMFANFDLIPPGASQPLIKPRSIDDVPILALTIWSRRYDDFVLRRLGAQIHDYVKQVRDVSAVEIIGGRRRQLVVEPDLVRLAANNLTTRELSGRLEAANQRLPSGAFDAANRRVRVETGGFLRTKEDVAEVVVGADSRRPVLLRDVARIADGGQEPTQYVRFVSSDASAQWPAVTLAVSKRKGSNATEVAERVLEKIEELRGSLIPEDLEIAITRNYGETAKEKSDELLLHMAIAVLAVSLLIWLTLGFRESWIVFTAIPVTLALTLIVFSLYGYTLNRITLFALIFSIGLLVDDAIVVVENIVRHLRLRVNAGRPIISVAVEAVSEVGNPTILATLTVIAAVLPMAFVSGLMGPYMRPIPVGASAAMAFSLLVAFMVTPWAAIRFLGRKGGKEHGHESEDRVTKLYRRVMGPLISRPLLRTGFLLGVVFLLVASVALIGIGFVKVKMLPFDNKSEFQIIIDMPEGTTLEDTARVAAELADIVRQEPQVTNLQTYVGASSPYNFNGLVRHYFLRREPHLADIQVNLTPKHERDEQSHEIAKRVRNRIQPTAARLGATVQVAEVPPGPPVLQTLVAEVYGPSLEGRMEVARQVREILENTDGVVDVDWYVQAEQAKISFTVDEQRAALHGISKAQIAQTIRLALAGGQVGLIHVAEAKEDVPLLVRLPRAVRSDLSQMLQLRVRAQDGALVPVAELVDVERGVEDQSIYHKNLMPVTYVTADLAGAIESPVYAILETQSRIAEIETPDGFAIEQYSANQPFSDRHFSIKWDGEWHITYEVFRDLGLAFAVVLVLIYILVVGWFESFITPLVIMSAIPFSLIGILPAHGLMGAFFTATSMIGFIAGAGIVVRNSIILVDFIELRRRQGMPLQEAVIDAGAVRFRPMMLTAAAVVVGASVILFDPIFQGLAISLMAGEVASLLLSRMTVPVVYYLSARRSTK